MTTVRAAVLTGLGEPLELRHDVEVGRPREAEVKVRITASGVCHSDLSVWKGVMPIPLPAVLGHEGAAVVEEVGERVTDVVPGDAVVISWVPQCGQCYFCLHGQPQLCQTADAVLFSGGLLDGTPRLRLDGQPLNQMCGTGTFCEATIIPATAAVKVPADMDPVVAALLGCSVLTGVGAALNTAGIRPGDSVAVVGCGGVGLNVVQGARIAGAASIIAVDVSDTKLALARRLGATETVDARAGDPVAAVRDLTGQRGADVAFEVIGLGPTIDQTIQMARRGGQAVLVGLPALEVMVTLPAMLGIILAERTIKGCWYGSSSVQRDVPRLVELYRTGELQLEALVSRRIELAEVNSAMAAMAAGEVARSVIAF